jgi:DNA-damage-inducible protein J
MSDTTTNISIRMDSKLKKQADELFADLGLNMTTAMTMFLRQAVRRQSIPFSIARDIPNAETMAAMKEAELIARDPNVKGYKNLDELFRDLNA